MVRITMLTSSVSAVHLSPVNDPSVFCGTLMGPTSLVKVPNHHSANDLATIRLFETMFRTLLIVWWLMNLFQIIGHVGSLDQ